MGAALSFNDLSTDRQANIARTVWDFGDPGPPGNRVTKRVPRRYFSGSGVLEPVSHTYAKPGSYKVTLTAIDTYGKRSRTSASVAVTAPPPPEQLLPPDYEE